MKRLFLPIIGLFFALQALAQNAPGCYTDYRNKGLDLMAKKEYGEAISQFVAALVTCKDLPPNNDMARQVQIAKETWIQELHNSSKREKEALDKAIKARDEAERAQSDEKTARQEAVNNAAEAYKRGIKAESLRLALLADMAREKGNVSDAILLAWISLQMSGKAMPSFAVRAFSEAIRDSFSVNIFNSPSSIAFMRYLPSHQRLLLETADHSFFVLGVGDKTGEVTQLPGNLGGVVPAHKQDSLLIWEGGSNNIRLIKPDGTRISTLTGHTGPIRNAAFSYDDTQLFSAARDNTARTWDLNGTSLTALAAHSAPVQEIHGFADKRIITRSSDGTAKLWSGKDCITPRFGPENSVVRNISMQDQTGRVGVVFADGSAGLFTADGKEFKNFGAGIKEVLYANQGFVVVRTDTEVQLYSSEGALLSSCPHNSKVLGMNVQNEQVLTWAGDNIVRLWNTNGSLLMPFVGHRATVISAVLSPDGKSLLTTARDGTAKLWDMEGNIVCEWAIGTNNPVPAIFSPNGQSILVTSNTGKSILLLPVLPMQVYQSIKPAKVLESSTFAKASEEYNIQFLEVLAQGQ